MLIDIIYIVLLAIAVYKGYTKGLIVAIFSIIAIIVGLAAAIKLSTVAASYLKDSVHITAQWLPVASFAAVFIVVVLLVRLASAAVQKTAELAMLGWANRIGGIVLYIALYTIVFSVLLFYASQINFITPQAIAASKTYNFIQPWGPKVINTLGVVIPWFKDMFQQLEHFFETLSKEIPVK
jgi:membrane protein required for colicin V production